MFDFASLQTLASAAAAKANAKANKPAPTPRKPGLHSRFLADLLATAGDAALAVPLTPAVDAWIAHQRERGGDLGSGATPEASISARIYCDAKAGKLPARVTVQAGRPAMLVVASVVAMEIASHVRADREAIAARPDLTPAEALAVADAEATPAAPEGVEGVDYEICNPTPEAVAALTEAATRNASRARRNRRH